MHSGYQLHFIAGLKLNKRPHRILALALLSTLLSGCSEKAPFELEAVRGTITYSDGSLIQADQLRVKFVPQGIKAKGKDAPRSSVTNAKVADGTFTDLTTWKYADGVMVGRHKVVVMPLRVGSHGVGEPTNAVPIRYQKASETPLEVEVISGGDNNFSLKVERGS